MLCHVFYKAQRRTERVAATGSPKRAKTNKTKKNAIKGGNNEASKVVEIGANRQSCGPPTMVLAKLALDVVARLNGALEYC